MSVIRDLPYLIVVAFFFGAYKLTTDPEFVYAGVDMCSAWAWSAAQFANIDAMLPDRPEVGL